jgi:uncharacterized protein YbbK (DUF523 family)
MIIVSACLAGIKCRYDGKDNLVPEIQKMVLEGKALPLCPEELGGLPTPRISCEIRKINGRNSVVSEKGEDLTREFQTGVDKVAKIAQILDCKTAILKSRSPSCGSDQIYDGSFSGKLIPGKGLCAAALKEQGVQLFNEENFLKEKHKY